MIINNNNLILSAAINYRWNDLKIFIKSLRKVSNNRVILIVDEDLDEKTKIKFKFYKIDFLKYKKIKLESHIQKNNIAQKRYEIYEQILKSISQKPKKIFLTDSRDVVFQSNIFRHKFLKPINFFLEEEKILNDPRNIRWLKRTVGINAYEKIKNKNISCSGTTLGNYEEILKYVILMKKNLNYFKYKRPFRHIITFKKKDTGYDQGIHNYLVHNNFFKNKKCYRNNLSIICTTAYMKKFKFNKNKKLLNKNGVIYDVIHQYDRCYDKNGKSIFNYEKIY